MPLRVLLDCSVPWDPNKFSVESLIEAAVDGIVMTIGDTDRERERETKNFE